MKIRWPYIFLACSALVFIFSINAKSFDNTAPTAAVIIQKTNEVRLQNGLPELNPNPLLSSAAEQKSLDMALQHYFAHQSPNGVTPWDWIEKNHYDFSYAGENLAINFYDSTKLLDAWLSSPTHKDNLLNPNYSDIGVSVRKLSWQGKDYIFIVQMLGKPRTNQGLFASNEP